MSYIVLGLAALTFISTLVGGTAAIKLKKHLPLFFAFAAGALVAVAFLDILPESIATAQMAGISVRDVMIVVVFSYLFYSFLERYFLTHHHESKEEHGHIMGPVGAGSLCIHSFLDGVAIGSAYLVSPSIGIIVALAVIFHDFTDGINTVTIMFRNKASTKYAKLFLGIDAIAPVLGVIVTVYLVALNEAYLAVILAIFVGEFLYIGASSILRETFNHPPLRMMLFMGLAVILILVLTSIV